MGRVIIGTDPHKASATIEVIDEDGVCLATGRFGSDTGGYRALLGYVRGQWRHRTWAVEGANGVGRPLAARLLADGERVLDVPAKLAARVRVFDTGQGRKTDATDAHAIALVALRTGGLRELSVDAELVALRLLADRRDELSRLRAQTVNRLARPRRQRGAPHRMNDVDADQRPHTIPAGRDRAPDTRHNRGEPCAGGPILAVGI